MKSNLHTHLTILGLLAGSASAPAATLNSVGNVYHVSQLTGNSSINATEARWNLSGTDIGTMFNDFAGNTFLAFGDSFAYFNGTGGAGPDWRHNLLARSSDKTPANGLDFSSMVWDLPNHGKNIIPREPGDTTTIPNGGISVGDKLYIHYMNITTWGQPGQWTSSGSGIAVSSDYGQTWTKNNLWAGNSGFIQAALVRNGGFIYFFSLPTGRFGGVKLARVPEANILNLGSYTYWTGTAWSGSQGAAATIVPAPVGELSVAYNAFLGRYIMLFLNENAHAVQIRTATALTGPWTAPINVTTGYNFPLGYGPMLHPNFSSGQEIYFGLSAWDPYNVHLFHATLNPTGVSWGPFDLPGRVEAENFREGAQGVAYHDTTAGNSGNAYRSGNVDLVWNINEDAHQVGWIANGEWLSYKVNVTKAGAYKFRLKYGSHGSCRIQVDAPGGNPVYVPATTLNGTGGPNAMRVWEPNTIFNLNAGVQFINLYFATGGCDVTWWEIYPAYAGSTYRINCGGGAYTDPTGKSWSADAHFTGGNTVAPNPGIANTLDDLLYGSERFGTFSYAFPVSTGGYHVRLKFAETYYTQAGQRRFHVEVEGARLLSDYDVIWRTAGQNVAKDELLTVYVDDGTLNLNFVPGLADVPKICAIEITPTDPALFANYRVPGHVEAEDFRKFSGSYFDTTPGNIGGDYRGKDVDIRARGSGGYQVGWIDNGEWLAYHIDVAAAGNYKFRLRYSMAGTGASVQLTGPNSSPVFVPASALSDTGNFDNFVTFAPSGTFFLNAGSQLIYLHFPTGGCDVDYFEIHQ